MPFYKITDAKAVEAINNEIVKSNQLIDSMLNMAKEHGFDQISIYDSLRFGINLRGFMLSNDNKTIDGTKWKSAVTNQGRIYTPKKSNKPFYRTIKEQYENFTNPNFSYDNLIAIYSKVYAPFKTYIYDDRSNSSTVVYLETSQLLEQPTDVVKEVLSDEFKAAYKRNQELSKEV